jgi:hypothetical protein
MAFEEAHFVSLLSPAYIVFRKGTEGVAENPMLYMFIHANIRHKP